VSRSGQIEFTDGLVTSIREVVELGRLFPPEDATDRLACMQQGRRSEEPCRCTPGVEVRAGTAYDEGAVGSLGRALLGCHRGAVDEVMGQAEVEVLASTMTREREILLGRIPVPRPRTAIGCVALERGSLRRYPGKIVITVAAERDALAHDAFEVSEPCQRPPDHELDAARLVDGGELGEHQRLRKERPTQQYGLVREAGGEEYPHGAEHASTTVEQRGDRGLVRGSLELAPDAPSDLSDLVE
jgi:hypothetical protein